MAASGEAVQRALQSVAEATRWTYSLLWQLCAHKGALVWAEGHYNGAIKTRKTVQPAGEEEEDDDGGDATAAEGQGLAARRRSRQLRELFDFLAGEAAAAGDGGGRDVVHRGAPATARRPSAALAPEDLTDTEWFYLMCASYCFPPGVGLPGTAFARGEHVWLTGANEVDSKVFSRAILAKSAGIQAVACIPVGDGVLEIGTTERVEENRCFIQYVRSLFMDQLGTHMVPSLSQHSNSNPMTLSDQNSFPIKADKYIDATHVDINNLNPEYENNEMEGDDDEIDTDCGSHPETNTEKDLCRGGPPNNSMNGQVTPNARSIELMQIEVSEMPRDNCSNNLDEEIEMLMICQNSNAQSNMQGHDEHGQWQLLYQDLCSGCPIPSAEDQAILPENAHYVETVLTILRFNAGRQIQAASRIKPYLAVSNQSSFSRWNPKRSDDRQRMTIFEGTPQRMLKCILLQASSSGQGEAQSPEHGGASRLPRGQAETELSASHVVKERRRREKLNERFIVLRSLVPFVTKMDRASILGDTIEYVKQLRRRIQDLESRAHGQQIDGNLTAKLPLAEAGREMRTVEASSSSCSTSGGAGKPGAAAGSTEVQVSIVESDLMLELRCPHRDGLLFRVMLALHRELRLEVTSVQASSSAGGMLLAELRAKVQEVQGRRSSITDVKRAIHLILSSE
ncbi:hypothetical protein ACP70R_023278 [Stipagrostis hirtigluma subsp. patula]